MKNKSIDRWKCSSFASILGIMTQQLRPFGQWVLISSYKEIFVNVVIDYVDIIQKNNEENAGSIKEDFFIYFNSVGH